MQLYSGSSQQFIVDTEKNQIAEKLRRSFFSHFRYYPSPNEVNSWKNSLSKIKDVVERCDFYDHGVILEYQLPLTSRRLDFLISGVGEDNCDHAAIVELKQWDKCDESSLDNEVLTWVGGSLRETLHPSKQVGQYKEYLEDCHTAFHTEPSINLHACSYLHNYIPSRHDPVFSSKFEEILKCYPTFTADDFDNICGFLKPKLSNGCGLEVLQKIQNSKYRPSKKLLDHVNEMIKQRSEYVLLDEQQVVYDKVLSSARNGFHDRQKVVLIVKGGPGTGKSVIAINLMADLSRQGYNAQYATGSKSFTETLRKIVGSRASAQFKYFLSYGQAEEDCIDVLIMDEAHRIRAKTALRYTPKEKRSGLTQIEELIKAAKVCVFFIDDLQVVKPDEIGSVSYITDYAERYKCKVYDYELEAQFRCQGSDAFVNWINNTLDVRKTANVIWDINESFEFKIFDSAFDLENAIKEKVDIGSTARVAAGFCWKWSDPNPDGTLVDDVIIGDFKRPWDAKHDAKKLAPGIPKASFWAYDPNGIKQVGCVYTAQGFEFDYIGVIFGRDLYYDPDEATWKGRRSFSADPNVKKAKTDEQFVSLVKNTYRVLLSRGIKGCYVHFIDSETKNFFKSRIDFKKPVSIGEYRESRIEKDIDSRLKYREYLPVYSLEAAATRFGKEDHVEEIGWVKINGGHKLSQNMFVAKVIGKSMEPTIPDNSLCIFRFERGGTRDNMVVLVESRQVIDAELACKYSVKRYHSEKEIFDDGTWRHKLITLSPDNRDFEPIILKNVPAGDFRVVAEFLGVID
jgi:uncharacterized protein